MKNSNLLTIAVLALSAGTVWGQDNLVKQVAGNGTGTAGYQFTPVVQLEATPVENQGSSGTCWSYSSSSFLESEMIRMGKKPVDLSEMYTVRKVYQDKAEKYVRVHGSLNFAQGGALPDLFYVIQKYGAVPEEAYTGLNYGTKVNEHDELEASLKGVVDAVKENKNGQITPVWKKAFTGVLDAYLGAEPSTFNYEKKTYTPRTFADQVVGIKPSDYVQICSFSHVPFYTQHAIEVPDNWTWGTSYNLPLNDMMGVLNTALTKGYTVAWACDVSEKGFSLKNGLAVVPEKDWASMTPDEQKAVFNAPHKALEITQENRQAAYDNYETQDDHGMQITGMVKDQSGMVFYSVKNSWGDRENPYKTGYIHASDAFVRYKTISIMLHKDALTKEMRTKLGI
jgi:bleomycin hydrolase